MKSTELLVCVGELYLLCWFTVRLRDNWHTSTWSSKPKYLWHWNQKLSCLTMLGVFFQLLQRKPYCMSFWLTSMPLLQLNPAERAVAQTLAARDMQCQVYPAPWVHTAPGITLFFQMQRIELRFYLFPSVTLPSYWELSLTSFQVTTLRGDTVKHWFLDISEWIM